MKLEFAIDPEIEQALPPGGGDFLGDVANILDEEYVRSVLLFGSVISKEATDVSDVDLIIVLEDNVPPTYNKRIRKQCAEFAQEHLAAGTENRVEQMIDRYTGMFRSGFVTTVSDVRQGKFHAIFDTSRLAYLLAPWRTVLASAFSTAQPIYGPQIEPDWSQVKPPLQQSGREILWSWVTTLLLAFGQVLYAIFSKRAMSYSMEAHKWSYYTCAHHLNEKPVTLTRAAESIPGEITSQHNLIERRKNPQFDRWYILTVPLIVTVVHFRTLGELYM